MSQNIEYRKRLLKHGVKRITLKHYNCMLRPALR